MYYQNNLVALGNKENQQNMNQPYYLPPNNHATYSTNIDQNYQTNQFYEKPKITNQDNNNYSMVPQQQINPNSQYFILPEEEPTSKYIKGNKVEIPYKSNCCSIFIFLLIFISDIIYIIFVPSFHRIYVSIVLLIEMITILYYDCRKIVIIKDEVERKIIVKEIYICCKEGIKFEFDLESSNFSVILSNQKYILFIINNFKNKKEIDLNTSNIRNMPLKFLYYFQNINVNKFNGQNQLIKILNDFVGLPKNQENPLNFDINAYIHKQQPNNNQYNYKKYIKLNDNFFTYYNNNPIKKNDNDSIGCLIKIISLIMRFYLLSSISAILDNSVEFPLLFFGLSMFYFMLFGMGFGIYKICCNSKNKDKCLRIDIIFSSDFDKIFIGSLNEVENTYINNFVFNINDINRFILQKNNVNDDGFSLIVMLKGNQNKQILYIKDNPLELEGLVYILIEKIVNNNNNNNIFVEQQGITDCPPPIAITY